MGAFHLDEYTELLEELFEQVPELSPDYRTKRADRFLHEPYYEDGDRNKALLPTNETRRKLELFLIKGRSILDQVKENPEWQDRLEEIRQGTRNSVALTSQAWNESPVSLQKVLQRKFTPSLFRLEGEREDKVDGKWDLSNLVIDPASINATLLFDLGLIPSKKLGKRMSQAEKMRYFTEFIPQIKEMLSSLEPLRYDHEVNDKDLKYFREFRIGAGPRKGYVLGIQYLDENNISIWSSDLYGARRRITHELDSAKNDTQILTEVVGLVDEVVRVIFQDWETAKTLIPELNAKLEEAVDKLSSARADLKVEIRERINKAVNFEYARTVRAQYGFKEDGTRGEVRPGYELKVQNVSVARNSLTSIKFLASKRRGQIEKHRIAYAKDGSRLDRFIEQQENLFGSFYRRVLAQHKEFAILHIDEPLTLPQVAKIRGNLQALASQCDPESRTPYMGQFFEPHLALAEKMGPHLTRAAELLTEDRLEAARQFTMAFLIAKIENFYVKLEQFLRTELPPAKSEYSFDEILKKVEKLNGLVGRKELAIYKKNEQGEEEKIVLETPEFDEIFGGIYHLLNSLKKRAKEGRAAQEERLQINIPGTNPEELTEEQAEVLIGQILLQMKNRIKEMRFDLLVRNGREESAETVSEASTPSDLPTEKTQTEPHPEQE